MERDVVAVDELSAAADIGTREGFEAWVAPHWPAMTHLAARLVGAVDREDVVQDALTLAWRKRDRFDPVRGSARGWLLALVADQARKSCRRAARHPNTVMLPGSDADAEVERSVDLERAIRRLTVRQKLAIDLYYFLDLPVAEVAVVMGCSEGTAKSTLADARARLHEYLGDRSQ